MTKEGNYLMVAGIDFGTTFSGYGFSFKGAEKDIKLNKNWGDEQGYLSYKAPTSVLLDVNEDFIAFGYEAEHLYLEEDEESEDEIGDGRQKRKQLHRNFKMMLHNKAKITTKTTVCSEDHQLVPAIKVFTFALKYLKDHMIEEISKEIKTYDMSMIRWVITVPAIWREESKQFMREAAFRAGCIPSKDSDQLIIALEPEAASFFCRDLYLAKLSENEQISFPSGTRYLVLDCGGGTNDMVVHEVVLDYKVKEICNVNGGPYGGNNVNKKFVALLKDLLGSDFIESYQTDEAEQWFNFMSKFERAKKIVRNDGKSKLKVELPFTMMGKYASFQPGNNLETALNAAKDNGISCKGGSIWLSHEAVKRLFKDTIDRVIRGVQDLIETLDCVKLNYIFMVGGFSENKLLHRTVKETFEQTGITVLIPQDAQIAIIKGAVLFGHYQDRVVSRIARKTYGVESNEPFRSMIHDSAKLYLDSAGEFRCKDIFLPLVNIGDMIEVGSSVTRVYPLLQQQTEVIFGVYSLDRKSKTPVEYIDSWGITKLGQVIVATPNPNNEVNRKFEIKVMFGFTEILVEANDVTSGNTFSTAVDFLSE